MFFHNLGLRVCICRRAAVVFLPRALTLLVVVSFALSAAFALALLAVLRQVGQSRTRLCPGFSCHCPLHWRRVLMPFVRALSMAQLRQYCPFPSRSAVLGKDSLQPLQVNQPALVHLSLSLTCS